MLSTLRDVLLMVLPTVIYAHYDEDDESSAEPPFIVYQEISKRPPSYSDDKPIYYERVIQINLITKKKDIVLEESLESVLMAHDYVYSLIHEYKNSDGSINRVYEIKLEEI